MLTPLKSLFKSVKRSIFPSSEIRDVAAKIISDLSIDNLKYWSGFSGLSPHEFNDNYLQCTVSYNKQKHRVYALRIDYRAKDYARRLDARLNITVDGCDTYVLNQSEKTAILTAVMTMWKLHLLTKLHRIKEAEEDKINKLFAN